MNNIEKQFVTYEIALKLKELGFDKECLANYYHETEIGIVLDIGNNYNLKIVNAPLYSQAIDWFREKHGIDIIIRPFTGDIVGEKTYASDIYISKTNTSIKLKRENSYHEAREQAILKCIELCQKIV